MGHPTEPVARGLDAGRGRKQPKPRGSRRNDGSIALDAAYERDRRHGEDASTPLYRGSCSPNERVYGGAHRTIFRARGLAGGQASRAARIIARVEQWTLFIACHASAVTVEPVARAQ